MGKLWNYLKKFNSKPTMMNSDFCVKVFHKESELRTLEIWSRERAKNMLLEHEFHHLPNRGIIGNSLVGGNLKLSSWIGNSLVGKLKIKW